jgi:hypothetical protein
MAVLPAGEGSKGPRLYDWARGLSVSFAITARGALAVNPLSPTCGGFFKRIPMPTSMPLPPMIILIVEIKDFTFHCVDLNVMHQFGVMCRLQKLAFLPHVLKKEDDPANFLTNTRRQPRAIINYDEAAHYRLGYGYGFYL